MDRLSGIHYMGFVTCVTLQKKIPAHVLRLCCEGTVMRLKSWHGGGSGFLGAGSFLCKAAEGKGRGDFSEERREELFINSIRAKEKKKCRSGRAGQAAAGAAACYASSKMQHT
ncbi:MAG: hypothetical protein M0033_08130, partial [Nitrospiraceae bacterium]|nr:hypothetical protein [Nitrospiraceae bacterium]